VITGNTKLLGLIGNPVSHSLSPQIHNVFSEGLKLDYVYLAFGIDGKDLRQFCESAQMLGFGGFNVTMPFKESIIPFLRCLDESAEAAGAVNTVLVGDGGLKGYNTDAGGFMRSLKCDLSGAKVLVLGTGGAAKTVGLALAEHAGEVRLASRHPESLPPAPTGTSYCHWDSLNAEAQGCSLLVNATPIGMHAMPDEFGDLGFLSNLADGATVYDLIYSPRETALLKRSKELGFAVANGLAMLVHQAALAYGIFTGASPLDESVSKLISEL